MDGGHLVFQRLPFGDLFLESLVDRKVVRPSLSQFHHDLGKAV